MSGLAKVFVVVNAVLALLFFGTSATLFLTRKDWQNDFNRLKATTDAKLDEVARHNKELNKRVEDSARAIIALRSSENKLAAALKVEQERVKAEQAAKAKAEGSRDKATVLNTSLSETVEKKDAAYQQLLSNFQQAQTAREQALADQKAATEQRDQMRRDLAAVQGDLQSSREEYQQLAQKYASMELAFNHIRKTYNLQGVDDIGVTPAIDGAVQDVDEDLVVLSVGREDDVKEGYEFSVYRDNEFIGKVKVTKVFAELAGAVVLFTKDGARIRKGDRAATQL